MELNERLRELRKEQGETQKQVAAAIGIGERPYQYLESGEHRPSLDTLIALADHFGVSLDYLAGRSDRRELYRAAVRRPRGAGSRKGLVQRDAPPIFFSVLPEKKTGRARSKRKERFWPQLCTGVQSCCTEVGVRWCLRVCEDWPTGAAGCGTGLNADSRGVDAEVNGVQGRI